MAMSTRAISLSTCASASAGEAPEPCSDSLAERSSASAAAFSATAATVVQSLCWIARRIPSRVASARSQNLANSRAITASDPPTAESTSFRLIAGVAFALLGATGAVAVAVAVAVAGAGKGAGAGAAGGAVAGTGAGAAAGASAGAYVGTAAADAPETPARPVPRGGALNGSGSPVASSMATSTRSISLSTFASASFGEVPEPCSDALAERSSASAATFSATAAT
eukprot:scaffold12738_cov81-Phaeocystis_antarctica.AAC.8